VPEADITWNYATWPKIAFVILAAMLVSRFLRTGGRQMLGMMDGHRQGYPTRRATLRGVKKPGFYIASSWFVAPTAASGRKGGHMPDQPGSASKGVHHDGLE